MSVREFYTRFDSVFFEKTRLSMMTILYQEEAASYNHFKKVIGGTDGAIYSHIRKLLEAGYVTGQKEIADNSAQTVYAMTESGKRLFAEYLQFLEKLLTEKKKNARRKNIDAKGRG